MLNVSLFCCCVTAQKGCHYELLTLIITILFVYSGFGFITFKDAETVQKILENHNSSPIIIDEKAVSNYNYIFIYCN